MDETAMMVLVFPVIDLNHITNAYNINHARQTFLSD